MNIGDLNPEQEHTLDELGQASSNTNHSAADDEKPRPLPPATLRNAVRLLESPIFERRLWYDTFMRRLMTDDPPREWTDADDLQLTVEMQTHRGFTRIGVDTVRQAALLFAFQHARNSVTDWLRSLKWDGERRLEDFFVDHFGAVKTAYTHACGKNFWLSIVARALQPGCQCDHMLVLEGPQGAKKSTALRVVGGAYFTEQHESVTSRAFFETLQGKLLVEISELDAFSRAEVTRVKQVITCVSDRFRESYGRYAKDHLRSCCFVGTTNKDDWNRDETGARRFWPIACTGEIDVEAIRANRDQYFAEAVARYKEGETWWETPAEDTQREQGNRYLEPAWVEVIEKYLENDCVDDGEYGRRWIPRAEPLKELSVAEVLEHALDMPKAQWTKPNEMRVGEALRFMGWIRKTVRREGRTMKRWLAPTASSNGGNSSNSEVSS